MTECCYEKIKHNTVCVKTTYYFFVLKTFYIFEVEKCGPFYEDTTILIIIHPAKTIKL